MQVLFVLSADRPLTESEVKFLQYVRQWGKKVVFVVNKVGMWVVWRWGLGAEGWGLGVVGCTAGREHAPSILPVCLLACRMPVAGPLRRSFPRLSASFAPPPPPPIARRSTS